jgi:site-specific recombinase
MPISKTTTNDNLQTLLDRLDPNAPLAERHLWLIDLFDWIRGDHAAQDAATRLASLIETLEARPEVQVRLQAWWQVFIDTVDLAPLLADFGFAPRTAFFSELAERCRRLLLPSTPETADAAELFSLVFSEAGDAQWLQLPEEGLLVRLAHLLHGDREDAWWKQTLLDAITACASQISATGFAPELRLRMHDAVHELRPFHLLPSDADALREQHDAEALQAAAQRLRERLDTCAHAASSVYEHLEDNGISVGLVFRVRQLHQRVLRMHDLLDCLLSPTPGKAAARLLATLAAMDRERRSLRALISNNTSLLASKVVERNADSGEHYITRDRAEFLAMLRKAAGGGALTSLTVWAKFALGALILSAFWGGFWAGAIYAVSFVAIQLLHGTLATKQPAMTAPAMAAKLKDLHSDDAVERFVDEVANLIRSQVAAVLGNVLLVAPCVIAISALLEWTLGDPMLAPQEMEHVLHMLAPLGPTLPYAAFTGVLLFVSSLFAGWVENWFVLHRLGSALRYNPRITAMLGMARARRWARFMRSHIGSFASNISLGFMLGLTPAFATFFGFSLEARHVTLATGQLAAAAAALGMDALELPAFWEAAAVLPFIGALNVGVSFYFAFLLALRAHNVQRVDRARIRAAIWKRWWRKPLSFFLPQRGGPKRPAVAED